MISVTRYTWQGRSGFSVMDKMQNATLRWFIHVKRSTYSLVRRCKKLIVIGLRTGSARPMNWPEVIVHNIMDIILDRRASKSRIRVTISRKPVGFSLSNGRRWFYLGKLFIWLGTSYPEISYLGISYLTMDM